jgi:putative ABC transport system substrate-binding protein
MRRREFLRLLGGAAGAWPLAAGAQVVDRPRHIALLSGLSPDDPQTQPELRALRSRLAQLGWSEGQNLKIEYRFAVSAGDTLQQYARELVALAPALIMVQGNPSVAAVLRETRSIPIVVLAAADPVGSGFAQSVARPGGNLTGFTYFEFDIAGKWLQLLKEIAPRVSRTAVLMHAETSAHVEFFKSAKEAASLQSVELTPVNVRNGAEIQRAIDALAEAPNGGLIALPHPVTVVARALILEAAARRQLPAVYPFREFVRTGGLVSYGPDRVDVHRRAADYVDRILRGAKPGDLPFQQPVKYETAVNLKTAKALGLSVPPALLARADEVIE